MVVFVDIEGDVVFVELAQLLFILSIQEQTALACAMELVLVRGASLQFSWLFAFR